MLSLLLGPELSPVAVTLGPTPNDDTRIEARDSPSQQHSTVPFEHDKPVNQTFIQCHHHSSSE